ncbi:MAG: SLC13/DASS family transporter [Gemmatimonadales bacterium]|nr:MAG: SLC13/DASS family transporter [Gemmatimonadales bacterium]
MSMKHRLGWILGGLFLLAALFLPPPGGMEPAQWRVAGIGLVMAAWWITEVLPIPVTALVPLALLPLLGTSTMQEAAAPFADPIIFLFLGGFMIAQAMQRWDLHRRLALGIILRTGTKPRSLVAGFMLATAFLSMWVSNTAVAVMMLPIALSVIRVVRGPVEAMAEVGAAGTVEAAGAEAAPHSGPGPDAFGVALLLGVAYAASIGGVATLIGTPPNALLAGYMAREFEVDVGFGAWMLIGLPVTFILLPITWLLLTRVLFPVGDGDEGAEAGEASQQSLGALRTELGSITTPEIRVAAIFALTALAWIFRPLLNTWIPGLSDAGIAIAATLILCGLPAGGGRQGPLLDWEWARGIPWGILLLFGGGLSLAGAITRTGLAVWIGEALTVVAGIPFVLLLLVVAGVIVFLTELTSNTATAAAFLPILAGLALALGHDPLLFTVIAALAASCAFMLPVATPPNAVVFGSGVIRMEEMVRAGLILNLLVIVLTPLVAFVVLRAFFGLG